MDITTNIILPEYDDYETDQGETTEGTKYLHHKYFIKNELILESFIYYKTYTEPNTTNDSNPLSLRFPLKMSFIQHTDSGKIIIN